MIWQCNEKYADRHNKCSTPHLSEGALQDLFVRAVNKIISRKDEIIRGFDEIKDEVFDTSQDEAKLETLKEERIRIVSDMEQLNAENARTTLDQEVYQRRFDQLLKQYSEINNHLTALEDAIQDRKYRKTKMELFLKSLRNHDGMVTEFSVSLR